jgi:hypothetical protein
MDHTRRRGGGGGGWCRFWQGVCCASLRHAEPCCACCAVLCYLQADHLLSLYHGEWKQSVDPIYSPDFTY